MRRTLPSYRPGRLARGLAALLAAATVSTLLSVAQAAPAGAVAVADRYAAQRPKWTACAEGRLECALLTVPRDWRRPGQGEDLKVAISRLRASDRKHRRGVMLLNPGGPGGSGLYLPLGLAGLKPVAAAYDLVGFDPRGVGRSTRIQCQTEAEYQQFTNVDMRVRSSANIDRVLRLSREIADNCKQRSGELLRLVNTEQTAWDMDLIRVVLKAPKISYLGYSAGTWLGARYATLFPQRVDRFVLDSNVDFTTSWERSGLSQPMGFERRFTTDFLGWLARNHASYGYGATASAARSTWESRRAALARQPLKVSRKLTLTAAALDNGVVSSMYTKEAFTDLASALVALEHFDRATVAEKATVEQVFGSFFDPALYAVFYAVTCNDTYATRSEAHWVRESARLGGKYPLIGYSWLAQPCASWPYLPTRQLLVNGRGLPGTLMVNSVRDPATPYEGAVRAHQRFAGSRLVTVENEGDHGIVGSGNRCVDAIAAAFLVDGRLPAADTRCAGQPLPKPAGAKVVAPQEVSGNVLERVREYERRYGGR